MGWGMGAAPSSLVGRSGLVLLGRPASRPVSGGVGDGGTCRPRLSLSGRALSGSHPLGSHSARPPSGLCMCDLRRTGLPEVCLLWLWLQAFVSGGSGKNGRQCFLHIHPSRRRFVRLGCPAMPGQGGLSSSEDARGPLPGLGRLGWSLVSPNLLPWTSPISSLWPSHSCVSKPLPCLGCIRQLEKLAARIGSCQARQAAVSEREP